MAGKGSLISFLKSQSAPDAEFDKFYEENLSLSKLFGLDLKLGSRGRADKPIDQVGLEDDRSAEEWIDDQDGDDFDPYHEDEDEDLDDRIQDLLDQEVKRRIHQEIEEEHQQELRERQYDENDEGEWVDD